MSGETYDVDLLGYAEASKLIEAISDLKDGFAADVEQAEEIIEVISAEDAVFPRGAHSWWRLRITDTNFGYECEVGDINFLATPDSALGQEAGGTYFASAETAGFEAAKAFDSNPATRWTSGVPAPLRIGCHFPTPVSVGSVKVSTGGGIKAIKTFFVEYSDDSTTGLDGTWTVAWGAENQTAWADFEMRAFPDPEYGNYAKSIVTATPLGEMFIYVDGEYVPLPGPSSDIGLTAFQKIVKPSMMLGRLPRFSPLPVGYTLTDVTADGSVNAAFPQVVPWTNASAMRFEGGHVHNDGANGWSAVGTFNYGNYVNDVMTTGMACNAARLEFDTDAEEIVLMMVGGGGRFRVLVDGTDIDADGGKFWDFSLYPPDGAVHKYKLDLIAGGAVKRVMIDAEGSIKTYGVQLPAGAQITVPSTPPRPVVFCDGTSIVEAGLGFMRYFTHTLGIDTWNCGVGGSGIFNPGPGGSGRVNMLNRKNWRHREFAFGFHQGIINDGADSLVGSDGTYADRFKRYLDQYRRILDDWADYQDERPWIATGYYPVWQGDTSVDTIYYALNDAMQQACSEHQSMAHYIAPFPLAGTFPGNSNATSPATIYLPVNDPHPTFVGSRQLGARIADQVRDVIYSGRF